jgi:protoporphyrinogen/coproporphyrinogen III oxidase
MTDAAAPARVLVVGGGITGIATAAGLAASGRVDVVVREASDRLGGKIRTTPFAGLAGVDEGADAFLVRQPEAIELARRVGLGDELTSPTEATATVWREGLHDLPGGIVLGVPGSIAPFVTTRLLSWHGKARAALEPLLPRTPLDDDSIGAFVRRRFGNEVHERLVDALVGSIYAADTDRFSLAAVPQLAALAGSHRSMLVAARRARRRPVPAGPVFAAPRSGMATIVDAAAAATLDSGGEIRTKSAVTSIEPDGARWRVDDETFDAVVLAAPAAATAPLLRRAAPDVARLLDTIEYADVIVVTLAVPGERWPERLNGKSGYLVPKPDQHLVTAVSFGSRKWAHWRPLDGTEVLRVSIGRDGLPVDHLDDEAAVRAVTDDVGRHLDVDLQPTAVRVSRWPAAFPQYRPHHDTLVRAVEQALPPGLVVAGASYRGIGIPACVRQADETVEHLGRLIADSGSVR